MITDIQYILVGLGLGILVAAPVGPVNVICIQRTLERGFFAGISAGIGAVFADGVIALAAASGIKAISETIALYGRELQFGGGIILILFGAKLIRGARRLSSDENAPRRRREYNNTWTIPQTFFLTITNPGAIFGMFALVGGAGTALGGFTTYGDAFAFVVSVMAGSMIWWVGLSRVIATMHHRLTTRRLQRINQFSGLILVAFGMLLLVRATLGLGSGSHMGMAVAQFYN